MTFEEQLRGLIGKASNAPFLFVGSGFSRRHLGTEGWNALLRRFSICGRDYEYYASKANGDLPMAAEILVEDFFEYWWRDERFSETRVNSKHLVTERSDALKLEIGRYLRDAVPTDVGLLGKAEEIAALKEAVIDGIITTNWDTLLEAIFEGYKPYVGQDSILRSSPIGIAEIYKIHGCCTNHRSLVLTASDYREFNERNHYLAAKLVTTFIEHPVLFIGYSLEDKNIQAILNAIVRCLGKAHSDLLVDRLLFLEWDAALEAPMIEPGWYKTDEATIPLTKLRASSFLPVYQVLSTIRRKIPTRVLRHLKEQVVELASTEEPKSKVAVVDIKDNTNLDDIEFVVGIGVATRAMSPIGYSSILPIHVFEDFLFEKAGYDAELLIKVAFPRMLKNSPNLPVFHYLKLVGISDRTAYENAGKSLNVTRAVEAEVWKLNSRTHERQREKLGSVSFDELVARYDEPHRVLGLLQFLDAARISTQSLRGYLQDHFDPLTSNKTDYRKAVCILDRLENPWPKEPDKGRQS